MLLQNTCYFFGKIIIDWGYLITGFYFITITNVSATGNKWLHLEIVLSQTLQVTRRFLDSKKFQTLAASWCKMFYCYNDWNLLWVFGCFQLAFYENSYASQLLLILQQLLWLSIDLPGWLTMNFNWNVLKTVCGCLPLLLLRLPKLPSQCYSNGLGNLGNLGSLCQLCSITDKRSMIVLHMLSSFQTQQHTSSAITLNDCNMSGVIICKRWKVDKKWLKKSSVCVCVSSVEIFVWNAWLKMWQGYFLIYYNHFLHHSVVVSNALNIYSRQNMKKGSGQSKKTMCSPLHLFQRQIGAYAFVTWQSSDWIHYNTF